MALQQHRNDIKLDRLRLRNILRKNVRGPAQCLLALRTHGFFRIAKPGAGAGFDLHKVQDAGSFRNDIHLASSGNPSILVQDLKPLAKQVCCRYLFAKTSDVVMFGH